MIKKIKIHLAFAGLLSAIYIVCSLIYNRSLSDLFYVFLYYLIIAIIVFCLNLIRNRKTRWVTFIVVIFAPFTYLIFTGTNTALVSSLEVLLTGLPLDLPFFPNLYSAFKERVIPPVDNIHSVFCVTSYLFFMLFMLYLK